MLFPSEKENGCVVFLQHLFLTIFETVPIIATMQENTEQQSNKPDIHGDSILRSLPIGIIAFDSDLKIIWANHRATQHIVLGAYIDKSLAKGTDDKIWQGWTEQLAAVISTGKPCRFDDVSYSLDDKTKLLRIICAPLEETESAKSLGGTITVEDVTEKVNIERRLANAERLAAVGKHASKVAHELNNPLDGILRYINLAMRIVEQENLEKPKEYLTQCREGLMRMVQIVSELLEFSRSTYTPLEYVKVEQIIEDAIKTMESRAEAAEISIIRNYTFGLPQVRSGNLFQVCCNLAKNALGRMTLLWPNFAIRERVFRRKAQKRYSNRSSRRKKAAKEPGWDWLYAGTLLKAITVGSRHKMPPMGAVFSPYIYRWPAEALFEYIKSVLGTL
jgi:nitrogen fixation/metabolism regulation signal transduction histidine kinase